MANQTTMPRSVRNNNPLNLRRTADHWRGLSKKQNDLQFFQFESMTMGWRAAFTVLTSYYYKHNLKTIREIINRWAPPSENLTEAYIEHVSDLTDIDPDEALGPPYSGNTATWLKLGCAMAIFEAGSTRGLDYFAMLEGWERRSPIK